MDSINSSVTPAPPIVLPRLRADSWPSRVRSRLVDDEGDGDAGGTDLPGELDGGLQLGAPGGAGGDLLREDARHSGLGE